MQHIAARPIQFKEFMRYACLFFVRNLGHHFGLTFTRSRVPTRTVLHWKHCDLYKLIVTRNSFIFFFDRFTCALGTKPCISRSRRICPCSLGFFVLVSYPHGACGVSRSAS